MSAFSTPAFQRASAENPRPTDRQSAKRLFDHLMRLGFGYDLIVREGPMRFWIDYLSVFVSHGLLLPSIIVFDFLRSLSFPLLPIRPEEGLTQLND